jgi:hypothetical protein
MYKFWILNLVVRRETARLLKVKQIIFSGHKDEDVLSTTPVKLFLYHSVSKIQFQIYAHLKMKSLRNPEAM